MSKIKFILLDLGFRPPLLRYFPDVPFLHAGVCSDAKGRGVMIDSQVVGAAG
jgi:hypothetical protein